ncbi:hypothetical protein HDU76_001078 [Blyttiomyces sp. JEL0837]|nr:hypothetical protein HDU76_001078 [Blyttiomyces sp. JEL0837]
MAADRNDYAKEFDIMNYVLKTATRGDPASVLKAMDDFGYNQQWHMSVGDIKGEICKKVIREANPKLMVEIGAFVGYSSVCFASLLSPGCKYVSFEVDPTYIEIAQKIIDHAGLSDRHHFIHGPFSETYQQLQQFITEDTKHVDVFFIDHWKTMYLSDFKIIEKSGFCRSGTIVIADNIIYPGAPDYLQYVLGGGDGGNTVKSTEVVESELEYSHGQTLDAVAISVMN